MLPHRSRLFILTGIRISAAVLHNFNLLGAKGKTTDYRIGKRSLGEELVENKYWILLAMQTFIYSFIEQRSFFLDFQPGLT